MSLSTAKATIYASVVVILLAALCAGMHGFDLADVQYAVRVTAGVAFGYFVVVYFARPMRELVGTKWPMKYRRTLGLCVAIALTVHYAFLFAFFSLSTESVLDDRLRFVTGMLGVVALYAMAGTSDSAAVRALGPRWKQLHRSGIHYLWFFFMVSYLLGAQKHPDPTSPLVLMRWGFVLLLMVGVALRAAVWLRGRVATPRALARER